MIKSSLIHISGSGLDPLGVDLEAHVATVALILPAAALENGAVTNTVEVIVALGHR